MLVTFVRVSAPFLPMLMEELHAGLTGEPSVHLCDWPDPESLPSDPELVATMDRIRDVVSTALRLREDAGRRVRLPLPSLTVAGRDTAALAPFVALVADEVNVKAVELTDDLEAHARFVLRPDGKVLGPRLGKDVQTVFAGARSGDWTSTDGGAVVVAGHRLEPGEFELVLDAPDGVAAAALRGNDAVVVLDTATTPELEAEGRARDVVRAIQEERKAADLVVTDRVSVTLTAPADVAAAVAAHRPWVMDQVLATDLAVAEGPETAVVLEVVAG